MITARPLRSARLRLLPGWGALLAMLVLALALALSPARTAAAGAEEDNCAATENPIACENALPGDKPSNWQIQGVGNADLQGYATSMSVNVGETEHFKVDTTASSYKIEILRLGYYGGDGARVVASGISPIAVQDQPECLKEPATGLIDCGNWGVSAEWAVPSNAVSGVYVAELTPTGSGGKSQIIFVVRNDAGHAPILLQVSDATWEAYNEYGGNSLYTCTVACPPGEPKEYKGAYSVSFNRPFSGGLITDNGASYLWYAEYQMMLWLEENGYNVAYTTEEEVDRNGALLKNHKLFMSSGHDEYWSAGQRANVEAAREAGVNLAFFSGNEIFWKTRWGPSIDGSNTRLPDAHELQGDPLRRPRRSQGPAHLDGGVARSPQPQRRRRQARKRTLRAAVRGQRRNLHDRRPLAVPQTAIVAQHVGREPQIGPGSRARAKTRSGTSGTKTSTTDSGRRGSTSSHPRP